jgi:nucleoid-associated protein YgaU
MKTEVKMGLALGTALIVIVAAAYFFGPNSAAPKTPDSETPSKSSPLTDKSADKATVPPPVITPPADTLTTPGFGGAPASRPTTLAVDIFAPTTQTTVPTTIPTPGPNDPWPAIFGSKAAGSGDGMGGPGGPSVGPHFGTDTGMTGTTGTKPPAGPAVAGSTYEVKSGDTFSVISKAVYGSPNYWSKIAAANPGVSSNHLKIGQKIKIPPLDEVKPLDAAPTKHTTPGGSSLVKDPSSEYQVQAGDTLTKIASKLYGNGNRWEEIYKLNKTKIGDSPTKLKIGMILKLPSAPKTPATLPSR